MKKNEFLWRVLIFSSLIVLVGNLTFAQKKETLRERIMSTIREKSQITSQEFQQQREQFQEQLKEKNLELRNKIQAKQMTIEQKFLEFKNRLKERLKKIKEERKQRIVETVYERINQLNKILTTHFLEVLEHLEKILERIESRTIKAELNGIDVSQVKEKIKEAYSAIETAKTKVEEQAGKIYSPPEITGEENLKVEVGKLRKQFHADIKAVEKLVKEAREKVRIAAITLAQIRGVDNLEIPTTTLPATPTEGTFPR